MSQPQYYVETRWGGSEDTPSVDRMQEIIAELAVRDEEHPDTWLTHAPSGWTITLDEDRFAYLSDPDCKIVAHMAGVAPEYALKLWLLHSRQGKEATTNEPWKSGSRLISQEEMSARKAKADAITLESDLAFYSQLGPEDLSSPCKADHYSRGRIKYSVLCRVHHFEQTRRKPCPFNE